MRRLLASILALGMASASAEETAGAKALSLIDLFVDRNGHIGNVVHVTGGKLIGASQNSILYMGSGVSLALDVETAEKETLRFALRQCNSIFPPPECTIDLVGSLGERNGRLVLTGGQMMRTPPVSAGGRG